MNEKDFIEFGYFYVKKVGNMYCGLLRLMYSIAICVDLNEHSWQGRLCFDTLANAKDFLDNWDGVTMPTKRDGLIAARGIYDYLNEELREAV